MIDAILIFTKGGVVLWSYYFIKLKGKPIDCLIKTVLLEEKTSQAYAYIAPFYLKWKLLNDLNCILVVVYQGFKNLGQIDSFLELVAGEFLLAAGGKSAISIGKDYTSFNKKFLKLIEKLDQPLKPHIKEAYPQEFPDLKNPSYGAQLSPKHSYEPKSSSATSIDKEGSEYEDNDDDDDIVKNASNDDSMGPSQNNQVPQSESPIEKPKFISKYRKDKTTGENLQTSKKKTKDTKTKKAGTTWDFIPDTVSQVEINKYDYSKSKKGETTRLVDYKPTQPNSLDSDMDSDTSDDLKQIPKVSPKKASKNSRFSKFFESVSSMVQNITGNMTLTEKELEKPLTEFKSLLMEKNVAEEIAEMVTSSVKSSLIGDKTASFTSAREMVKNALTEAIQKILTPKDTIDVLQAALESKQKGKVYSMVFLGVNGVGKSTNLAKVCYYLKTKGGLKVMIVACDTFRSGAVEQLKHHAKCLDVFLFEKGYGKDSAQIAQEGLKYAAANGYDVVLIDTAGRMQDNVPLMRSLGKLISINNPDLLLFVGEALVGNDGVDQIKKFNQCLIDMSDVTNSRKIDGILLTKFDTVDDKVGAALSMVYITGQPIVFIGVGQKYPDLKKLKAKTCVKALIG